MLYICIPAYNEAPTIGVLLWRIRKVLKDFPARVRDRRVQRREHRRHRRDAAAVRRRAAAERARRGAATSGMPPRWTHCAAPSSRRRAIRGAMRCCSCRRLHRPARAHPRAGPTVRGRRRHRRRRANHRPWRARRGAAAPPVRAVDVATVHVRCRASPTHSHRSDLIRIAVVRDLIKQSGDAPIVSGAGWAANVDLLSRTIPLRPPRRDGVARAAIRYQAAREPHPPVRRRAEPLPIRLGDPRSPHRSAVDGCDMIPVLVGALAVATALTTLLSAAQQPADRRSVRRRRALHVRREARAVQGRARQHGGHRRSIPCAAATPGEPCSA